MGKLIDADRLKEVFSRNVVGGNAYFDLIDNAPTVEAIPKADYENRLKADLVAMLEELQSEIEECVDGGEGSPQFEQGVDIARAQVVDMIQQEIDKLKGVEN